MPGGVELGRGAGPAGFRHQHIVHIGVGVERVAGAGQVGPRRAGRDRRGQRQPFGLGLEDQRQGKPSARRAAEDGHLARIVAADQLPVDRHRVVERRGIRKVRRHLEIDRDHLEAAIAGHEHALAGARLAGKEHEAAAVQMHQQALAVLRRQRVRRDGEDAHPCDGAGLDRDVEARPDRGNVGRSRSHALRRQFLPGRRALRHDVPAGRIGRSDERLQRGAHRAWYRQGARRERTRREIRMRLSRRRGAGRSRGQCRRKHCRHGTHQHQSSG